MREIKFRAWDKNKNEMGEFELSGICANGAVIYTDNGNEFDIDMPIMQYTGLEDKNGKEIYEGDIVDNGHNFPVEIEFKSPAFEPLARLCSESCEVIGNIHSNPELLK